MKENPLTGKAFEGLFREYFRPLTVYAMQFVKDQQIAEDIVQELYLNLYEKNELLRESTLTKNYLYKSVYNRCLNHLEHKKIRIENLQSIWEAQSSNPADPHELITFIEFENKFLQVLEILSPRCRKIFRMSRIERKKNQEIADELNLSKRTVETHITQALKIMRKKLCKYLPVILMFFGFIVFFFYVCFYY